MQEQLSDRERMAFAQLEYEPLSVGQPVRLGGRDFGRVLGHVAAPDGFTLFVIGRPAPSRELVLLFKGSTGLRKGNPTTWSNEWLATNLPLLGAILRRQRHIPSQLRPARRVVNRLLAAYPTRKFYLYGHSLGAINAQYAVATCRQPGRVKHAWLYEGTNLYPLLTPRQRHQARKYHRRIESYVDIYDPVTLGYVDDRQLVGTLRYVDSERQNPVSQHMWGGYHFDDHGAVALRPLDAHFAEVTRLQQELIARLTSVDDLLHEAPASLKAAPATLSEAGLGHLRDWLERAGKNLPLFGGTGVY
mgnify:CR=1 FL=1